jgi:hypothetical protein
MFIIKTLMAATLVALVASPSFAAPRSQHVSEPVYFTLATGELG